MNSLLHLRTPSLGSYCLPLEYRYKLCTVHMVNWCFEAKLRNIHNISKRYNVRWKDIHEIDTRCVRNNKRLTMCFFNLPVIYHQLVLFCCMPTTLFNLRYVLDIPTGAHTTHVLRIVHRSSLRLSLKSPRLFFQFACTRLTLRGSQKGKHIRYTFLFICILLIAFTPRIMVAEIFIGFSFTSNGIL